MRYNWVDYSDNYKNLIDSWLDSEALKFTGCDDGFDNYFNYWKNDKDTVIGVNFWSKVIFDGNIPFTVIAFGLNNQLITISEFIVAPAKRGKGYGSSALRELIEFGSDIIRCEMSCADAVIFPDNIPSQDAFEKAGFRFSHAHHDGDAWYYTYKL